MTAHINSNNIKYTQRRLLVSDLQAKEILLATSLVQWYLNHGLRITKIHQVVEYVGKKPFKNFVHEVTEKRKEGTRDPNKAVLAQTYKLIGNSSYGSMLMNQTKFDNTDLVSGEIKARQKVNSRLFKELEVLGGELYEVTEAPCKTHLKMPLHIGFQILQLAKQRMLEFAYDFVARYIERPLYQYLYCDTDSLYISLARDNLEECVFASKRTEFRGLIHDYCCEQRSPISFLSRGCCDYHKFEDDREPGLLKVEFHKGDLFIGLCSKTYVCESSDKQMKLSCKGVNKSVVMEKGGVVEVFRGTLSDKKSREGFNGGIRQHKNAMYSYVQKKDAFTYLYIKRNVDEDGIYTSPLNLVLNPVPCDLFPINTKRELRVEYQFSFKYGNRRFRSIMHALVFHMVLNDEKNTRKRDRMIKDIWHKSETELKRFYSDYESVGVWDEVKFCLVKDIIRARLGQDDSAKEQLVETNPSPLVYADMWDGEWCAGEEWNVIRWIGEKDSPGKNYLGVIYSALRDEIV